MVKQFQDVSDDKIVNIIEESINKMEEAGAEVVELSFDHIDMCLPTYYLINYVEFFSATRKYDGRKYGERIEEVCGEEVLRRINMALLRRYRKKGAPIIAVSIPRGISMVVRLLATSSMRSRKKAPNMMLEGRRTL